MWSGRRSKPMISVPPCQVIVICKTHTPCLEDCQCQMQPYQIFHIIATMKMMIPTSNSEIKCFCETSIVKNYYDNLNGGSTITDKFNEYIYLGNTTAALTKILLDCGRIQPS